MKKIIIAVLLAIAGTCVNAQKTITYLQYQNGTVEIKKDSTPTLTEVAITFEKGVPELLDEQIVELVKEKKLLVSEKFLKGKYSVGIIYFTPRVEQDFVVLENGKGSHVNITNNLSRQLSLWYVFGLISMVLSFLTLRLIKNKNAYAGLVAYTASATAFAATVSCVVSAALVTNGSYVVSFAFAATSVSTIFAAIVNKKEYSKKNIYWYFLYNILMVIFFVLCYLQV